MATTGHQLHAVRKLLEVVPLRGVEGVPLEEWNHDFQQIRATTNDVAVQMLTVVVEPPVCEHLSHSEELAEFVKTLDALRALRHRELV